jgi:DNA-binding CsgD family transcriptional regulator
MIRDLKSRPAAVEHAWRLAMTGQYAGWQAIATWLAAAGQPQAHAALADPDLRRAMNRVCIEAAEDAATLARTPAPPGPRHIPGESDEDAIWRTIVEEHRAYWSRDADYDSAYHLGAEHEMLWGWQAGTGVTIRRGWNEFAASMHDSVTNGPEPNPYVTLRIKRHNKSVRIRGDVAWATFDEEYPTDHLPSFRGPGGCIHELRILERDDGVWKFAFMAMLDEQSGQTATPTWQVDRVGRVLWQNAAAIAYLNPDADLQVKAGRLRMRDAETDARFRAALDATVGPPECLLVGQDETPVVFDPGNDEPARVWWVKARSGKLYVSVNDPALLSDRLALAALAFRLSPAQQRLSFSIANGLTLEDAAQREGVRVSTARTQLQRTYDKVGVRSQAALVRALMAATAP